MSRSRRFFISDIHLSSSRLYDEGHAWFNNDSHKDRLLNFLSTNILDNPKVKDLVLLGDVFDTWVCPAEIVPPTYREIFDANTDIIAMLKEISENGVQLFYVNGNHDFDLSISELREVIPDVLGISSYKTARLHAEHGHVFDPLFNGLDRYCDPGFGRPIGYVMSRLAASVEAVEQKKGFGLFDLPSYLDDLVEAAVTSQNVFESIIEGLAEQAYLSHDDPIKMPGGKDITIGEAMSKYGKLSDKYNTGQLITEIWSRSSLNRHADRMCKKQNINIVILGHSHKSMLDKDFFLVEDRIYANSGTWCKKNAYCVDVDKKANKDISVTLHRVDDDGTMHKKVRKSV